VVERVRIAADIRDIALEDIFLDDEPTPVREQPRMCLVIGFDVARIGLRQLAGQIAQIGLREDRSLGRSDRLTVVAISRR
jgi:hypothetical protein